MNKVTNICLDLETLSLKSNAAIISIGARAFKKEDKLYVGDPLELFVDSTSCLLLGMDVDKNTIDWWKKNTEAKSYIVDQSSFMNIKYALERLNEYISSVMEKDGAEQVRVWCQGSDFDIPILRNAYYACGIKPFWSYRDSRDARGYFLEAVSEKMPECDAPYSLIKTDGVKHTTLSDVDWTINAIQFAYDLYNKSHSNE